MRVTEIETIKACPCLVGINSSSIVDTIESKCALGYKLEKMDVFLGRFLFLFPRSEAILVFSKEMEKTENAPKKLDL
jgi:hypothetical protein